MTSRVGVLLLAFIVLYFETAMAADLNVVTALQTALQGNDDMRNVLRYLNLAKDELSNDLPVSEAAGTKDNFPYYYFKRNT